MVQQLYTSTKAQWQSKAMPYACKAQPSAHKDGP